MNNNDFQLNFPCVSILYHPLTGQRAQVNDKNELEFGNFENQKRWIYDGSQILLMTLHRSA